MTDPEKGHAPQAQANPSAAQANPPAAQVNPIVAAIFGFLGGKKPSAPQPQAPVPQSPPPPPSQEAAPVQTSSQNAGGSKPPAPALPPGPLVTVITRNEFYRDGFRGMVKVAILEAFIIVGLILSLIVYMNNSRAQDRYFATTADGRIMRLVPLDRPNISTAALMSWVAQAATETMTFGFHDYQRRLQQSSRHFTKHGWETFTTALQRSRIIDSVQKLQQVVTAVPSAAPILIQQGVLGGTYRWIIEMPIDVTYQGGGDSRTDKLKLHLVIERVPSLENPNGVGIEQWVATQR